jgi:hypothetical protein
MLKVMNRMRVRDFLTGSEYRKIKTIMDKSEEE